MGLMVLLYLATMAGMAVAIVVTPFYFAYRLGRRAVRAVRQHTAGRPVTDADRDRAVRDLRERYAAGALTVGALEGHVEEVLRSDERGQISWAFADLPRASTPLRGAAAFEVCAGVALLLVDHSAVALALGALLTVGALFPVRGRVPVYAFLAGLALLAAPLAAVPLGACAFRRWLDER